MHASARGLERGVVARRRRAGDAQDAVAVLVLDDRPAARSRRRAPRTATIDSSRANGTNASRISGTPPSWSTTRRRRRPSSRSTAWPLPS